MLPAIGNIIGGVISSAANLFSANSNRRFQERMSSTAHQREVEDLKKAGLNPILSAMGGSGASTPSGSAGMTTNPAATFSSDYVSGKRLNEVEKQQLELNKSSVAADIGLKQSQSALNTSAISVNEMTKVKLAEDTRYLGELIATEGSKRAVNSAIAAREAASAGMLGEQAKHYIESRVLMGLSGAREVEQANNLRAQAQAAAASELLHRAQTKSEELRQFKLANEANAEKGFLGEFVPFLNKGLEPLRKMIPFADR